MLKPIPVKLLITGEEYVDKHYVKKKITKSRKETLKLALEEGNTTTQTSRIHHHSTRLA